MNSIVGDSFMMLISVQIHVSTEYRKVADYRVLSSMSRPSARASFTIRCTSGDIPRGRVSGGFLLLSSEFIDAVKIIRLNTRDLFK
jgi:hypothetical protein